MYLWRALQCRAFRKGVLLVVLAASAPSFGPNPTLRAQSQATAPFSSIVAADPAEYTGYKIKLTYTGDQTKTVPTLVLFGPGASSSIDEFLPFRTPDVAYENDDERVPQELSVSAPAIEAFVGGLAERPQLQVHELPAAVLSIMILRPTSPTPTVFEHLADEASADQALNVLEAALRGEPLTTRRLFIRFRNFAIGPH